MILRVRNESRIFRGLELDTVLETDGIPPRMRLLEHDLDCFSESHDRLYNLSLGSSDKCHSDKQL